MKGKAKLLSIVVAFLIATFALSILPHQAKSTSAGLVGYWEFDEGSGNIAHDSSGNGNNGAIYAGSFVEGKIGYAMSFDGSSQYVSVANSASLTITSQITVSAWVKSAGIVQTDTIVRKGNSYSLYLEGGHGNVAEVAIFQGGAAKFVSGTTIITPGLWYHIAGTFDGTNLKIYVNGILEGSLTTPGGIDNQPTLEGNLNLIIAANSGLGDFFSGIMDEVKIYNRALTSDEIYNDIPSEPTPIWMQWWFWTIIALGAIVAVLAFATVHYRKKPSVSKGDNSVQGKTTLKANKICPKCGANLPADSKFCGKCGTSLE